MTPLAIRATREQLVAMGDIAPRLIDPDPGDPLEDGRYSVVLHDDDVLSLADVERTYYIAPDGSEAP